MSDYSFINRPAVKKDLMNAVDPLGFQIKYKEVRTLLLKQFPYHIHYLIDHTNKQIIILAVIHAYKNPIDYSKR